MKAPDFKHKKLFACAVVSFWLIMIPVGGLGAMHYLTNTKMVYDAPKGSIVYNTHERVYEHFTTQVLHDPMYLLFRNVSGGDLNWPSWNETNLPDNKLFYYLSRNISEKALNGEWANYSYSCNGYYISKSSKVQVRFAGTGSYSDLSLIIIDINREKIHMKDLYPKVKAYVNEWLSDEPRGNEISLEVTSVYQITNDLQTGIIGDLAKVDLICIPFAMIALAVCVRSFRMLILPAISIPIVFACGLGIMYPVSTVLDVSSFAPELSAAVMVAISLDYTLFICSRFNEQVALQEAIRGFPADVETKWIVAFNTAWLSAENIVVSGFTIAAALGGMATIPVSFLATIGIAFGMGSAFAVLVNLTFMPCFLFLGYNFFRVQTSMPMWLKKFLPCYSREDAEVTKPEVNPEYDENKNPQPEESQSLLRVGDKSRLASSAAETTTSAVILDTKTGANIENRALDEHMEQERDLQWKSVWFKIGRLAFRRPAWCALAVVVLCSPFFYLTSTMETNFSLYQQVPRTSPHAQTLETILSHVGNGGAVCYYVLFDGGRPGYINSTEGFEYATQLALHISRETNTPMDRISSFANPEPGISLTFLEYLALKAINDEEYFTLWNHTVNADNRMALLWVCPPIDPMGDLAPDYLNKLNDAMTWSNSKGICNSSFPCGFMGAGATSWAIMDKVISFFPTLIGVTFSFIFVFIAVVFRSVFIPIRMLFTVGFTVAFAFGIGVLVFQFSFTHVIWTAMKGVNSFVWLVPIMNFSLLCALALDYDVFLVTRIIELKRIGYDDEAAISKAVWKTGRIISFAGLIMSISFGSLMFSDVTTLNQFGFVSLIAVLTDTLIIRPIFTPALMSMKPSLSWWPRKFNPTLTVDDMKESGHE